MDTQQPFVKEISAVLELYGAQAKVTTPTGFGLPCLSVRPLPSRPSVELELQLHGTYPYDIPTVSFEGLSNNEAESLYTELERVAEKLSGTPMLLTLLAKAREWIRKHPIEQTGKRQTSGSPAEPATDADQPPTTEEPGRAFLATKADRMRTAGDIISRIRWDGLLDSSDFSVTYLDRFRGAIETPFVEVDWDEAPFPQHRIQCFAFRGVPVWDKRIPLDHMFGSRGEGLKIEDVMQCLSEEGGQPAGPR